MEFSLDFDISTYSNDMPEYNLHELPGYFMDDLLECKTQLESDPDAGVHVQPAPSQADLMCQGQCKSLQAELARLKSSHDVELRDLKVIVEAERAEKAAMKALLDQCHSTITNTLGPLVMSMVGNMNGMARNCELTNQMLTLIQKQLVRGQPKELYTGNSENQA